MSLHRDGDAAITPDVGLSALAARFRALTDVRFAGWLYFALTAAMATPILLFPVPRGWDIVNHWARLTLLRMSPSDPLNALYEIKWALIPNLGVDLFYLALSPVFSPESVIRLAWVASFALPASGVWRINRAFFDRPQLTILLAPLLSYNLVVTIGLLNFAFGMGVALHALALWRTLDRRRWVTRLIVFNGLSVVMFFCHIAALAAFCAVVGMLEATPGRGERWREPLRRCLLAPFSVIAALALLPFVEPVESRFLIVLSTKYLLPIAPFLTQTVRQSISFSEVVVASAFIVLLVVGRLTRRLSAAPGVEWMLLGFGLMVLITPSSHGVGNFIDARMAVLWAYVAIALARWEWSAPAARWFQLVVIIVAVARVGLMIPEWRDFNLDVQDVRSAFRAIPAAARVLAVVPPVNLCHESVEFKQNLAAFAIIDRRAASSVLFSGRGMQLARPRDPDLVGLPWVPMDTRWLSEDTQNQVVRAAVPEFGAVYAHWRDHFNAVVDLHGGCAGRFNESGYHRVATSQVMDVYLPD